MLLASIMIISISLNSTNASRAIDDAIGDAIGEFKTSPRTEYTTDTFIDVDENQWYAPSVKLAYELGIMTSKEGRMFDPNGSVLISEAVAMAARVHSIYSGSDPDFASGTPWYQAYVDYAIDNKIIQIGDVFNYNKMATRAEMAYIFANSVPTNELTEINKIETIPDVKETAGYGQYVYRLYRAGILTGNDSIGTFSPVANATRAQAAAIIARVVAPDERRVFSIDAPAIIPDEKPKLQVDAGHEAHPGKVLYKGIPVNTIHDGQFEAALGAPLNKQESGGDTYYYYDGLEISVYQPNGMVFSMVATDPSLFTYNGISLDKNRTELIGIFGDLVYEGWLNDKVNTYSVQYYISGLINFEMSGPDEKAEFIVFLIN